MSRLEDEENEIMQEQAVAEELGVAPEQIELPPGVSKGIVVFELTDGSYGFRPMNDKMTLMDALMLCQRMLVGLNADIIAQRILASRQQAPPPKILIPGRKQ